MDDRSVSKGESPLLWHGSSELSLRLRFLPLVVKDRILPVLILNREPRSLTPVSFLHVQYLGGAARVRASQAFQAAINKAANELYEEGPTFLRLLARSGGGKGIGRSSTIGPPLSILRER